MKNRFFRSILYPFLYSLSALICLSSSAYAQSLSIEEREAEWQGFKVPSTLYSRFVDQKETLSVRVPADWKKYGEGLTFAGPEGSQLNILVEEIPYGIPLKGYVEALLQGLRNLPGGPDSLTVRKTQIAGNEAREILFEVTDTTGTDSRRLIWTTVEGANAFTFILITPAANAAEIEPYFKGVMQSVLIFRLGFAHENFKSARAMAFEKDEPVRIDEAQAIAPDLDSLDIAARARAIEKLTSLFAINPDPALDLLADSRSMVRAAAVDAIVASGNKRLVEILLFVLDDSEPFVYERAAKRLAENPGIVSILQSHTANWFITSRLLRVWPFLDAKPRVEIAGEMFKAKTPDFRADLSKGRIIVGTPPPPPAATTKKKTDTSTKNKISGPNEFMVVKAPQVAQKGSLSAPVELLGSRDYLSLLLLNDIPPTDFKMPLKQIVARGVVEHTAAALQIAEARLESLPLEDLFKLLDSTDNNLQKLAAIGLARSAASADIPRIEAEIKELESPPPPPPPSRISNPAKPNKQKPADKVEDKEDTDDDSSIIEPESADKRLVQELRLTVRKIRLREQLDKLPNEEREPIVRQAISDASIADWVWNEYARDLVEGPRTRSGAPSPSPATQMAIAPLGENIFPTNVTSFTAIPNLSSALDKLDDSLGGIQMHSARGQASLVLLINSFKDYIRRLLATGDTTSILDYIGIKPDSPAAVAVWKPKYASASTVERKAVVIRVANRERFERLLSVYQSRLGGFKRLPDTVAIGSRLIGLAPAILPLGAAIASEVTPPTDHKEIDIFKESFVRYEECNGYQVKVISLVTVNSSGGIDSDPIYLAYVGDTAVLASDWFSLRDVLTRLASGGETLAANPEFKKAVATGGDVIYMSNLGSLFSALTGNKETSTESTVLESGSLKISNNAWENLFNLSFTDRDWLKVFSPFQLDSLSSPKELLPASTVAYLMMEVDAPALWRDLGSTLFGVEEAKQISELWEMDFEKEVLPELSSECGFALLALPKVEKGNWTFPWTIFFKLKSDKLITAIKDGRLFKEAQTSAQAAKIKIGANEIVATVRNGYLIFAGDEATLARLDGKEKLSSTRDFARAAQKTPTNTRIFGGYSIEAANADLISRSQNEETARMVAQFASMAEAFHSQHFYATASDEGLAAKLSVSLDREGRYSVGELSALSKLDFAFAVMEARGAPISDQQKLESLKLKITAKDVGAIERIKEDLTSPNQNVEKRSENELIITVRSRHPSPAAKVQLPISGAEFSEFLKPTNEIRSTEKSIVDKAREIAGTDTDAWSVARKLADWTYKNIKWKRVDYADAAQTLATHEADCQEFSELYVAMARSLGLPSRIVSGLAYGEGSFGGHAWVEVYVGEWVELDPTWGTEFADATHVRAAKGDVLSYAVLNVLSIEIIEAKRGVADFQRDAMKLATKLCEELSEGSRSALTSALDIEMLADEFVGSGSWAQINDSEREQMWNAYRRLVAEITGGFRKSDFLGKPMRTLKVDQDGDKAVALVIQSDIFGDSIAKFHFIRRGEAWMLKEITRPDTDFHIISESFKSSVAAMRDKKAGRQQRNAHLSPYARALLASRSNVQKGLEVTEQMLKENPRDRYLRFVKATCLEGLEKVDEAAQLYTELISEDPAFMPALWRLAAYYGLESKQQHLKAVELYEQYANAEPDDPRPHTLIAKLHLMKDDALAEAAYRAALARDPHNSETYSNLAYLMATKKEYAKSLAIIDEGIKQGCDETMMISSLFSDLGSDEATDTIEEFFAANSERMKNNLHANLSVGWMRVHDDRAKEALPLFKRALELDPKNISAHNAMSETYRTLRDWRAALQWADAAIKLSAEDADAHYNRACALARLGRAQEAIAALKRVIELDEEYAEYLADEEDLKPLARLPQFKKLLPKETETETDK